MVRTINRQPYTVKQLDYGDVKYKFFNHSNWKGVCDDKNYLGVDQETFADSKNVYVDSEGLLKSRPSVKLDGLSSLFQKVNLYIKNIETFGQWYVVYRSDNYLELRKVGVNLTIKTSDTPITESYKLVQADQKIFVFRKNKLSYFDLSSYTDIHPIANWVEDASDKIYVPVTEVVNGLVHTENESKNVLTGKTITSYIYDSTNNNIPSAELLGKDVKVYIAGKLDGEYLNYQKGMESTINSKVYEIDKTKNFIGNMPLFWTNDTGYVLLGEKQTASTNVTDASFKNYTLYYSNNGVVFNQLPYLADTYGIPALSKSADHVFAVLFKSDGPYAYTLFGGALQSDGSRIPYTTWTKLPTPEVTNIVAGYGDFIDETLFSICIYDKKVSSDTYGTVVYTYKNNKYTKHSSGPVLVDVGNLASSYGSVSMCCAKDVTSFVYRKPSDFHYVSAAVYNDYDATISNFYGEMDTLPIPQSVFEAEHELSNRVKQQIYGNGVYVAFAEGDTYIGTDKLRFTLMYSYVSETDIQNHVTTIPSEQKSKIIRSPIKNAGHYAPTISSSSYWIALSSNLSVENEEFFVQGNNSITKYRKYGYPLGFVNEYFYDYYLQTAEEDGIYFTKLNTVAYLQVITDGELTFDVFDHETELSQFFVSKGKNLYINAQGSNVGVDDFKWYFPERNVQEFDYEITNLHPISTTEIAVFLRDSIYYIKPVTTTINGIETIAYSYYKSRIPLGCEEGSEVITSYDNKYTMFVTKRGFVAMSYQDFIASDEQALTFLSDTIYDMFNEWNQGAIKLFQYNFWIILYRTDTGKAFIFDMRGNSWWPIEYNSNVKKFIEIDRKPLLLSGLYLYKLDSSNDNYFDGNSLKDGRIDWFLSSQKLHLDAINYYKHIVNLTFFGYNYGDKDVNVRFNLRVINYRKQTDTNETKSFSAVDYKIQLTRTFVTRINYYKVNQVQYILESSRDEDAEDKIPVPLSLTAISLKYLVTGQVR